MSVSPSNDDPDNAHPSNEGASVIAIATPPSRVLRLAPTDEARQSSGSEAIIDAEIDDGSASPSDEAPQPSNEAPGKM
ncbi:MAG: hypothetical protein EBU34_09510 [Alphaproteobacteria bacterium]|nr:hypothetical protein [Alphaproteobacteria bacterium]